MYLGTSKIAISPLMPLRLSGYASRKDNFKTIKEDIFLRVHYFFDTKNNIKLAFIYADILWWGTDFVNNIKFELERKFNLPADNFIFIASHNHSGPPTSNSFTKTLETYNGEYAKFLYNKVIEGIELAKENLEEVYCELHTGFSNLNVFRRVVTDEGVLMRPNYNEFADKKLTVLKFIRKDNSSKAFIVHYPCHANISDENNIQPDYPGITLRLLDEMYANSISIFMQGATADLRPNVVLGDRFTPQEYERVKIFANYFLEDILKALENEPKILELELEINKTEVNLYMENLKEYDEVKNMLNSNNIVEREWAEKVLEKDNRNYETLEIRKVNLSNDLTILTYNCELSQEYSLYAQKLNGDTLTVAYSNGMIGYICTEKQILEGGYEPNGSSLYFALPGNYKPEIEEAIKDKILKLLRM